MNIPSFRHLHTLLGLYRLPSGRIAEMVEGTGYEMGQPVVTLKYLDAPDELITVKKSWLAANAVVV